MITSIKSDIKLSEPQNSRYIYALITKAMVLK